MIQLSATPVLETERLILRAPVATDYPAYAEFATSDRTRYMSRLADADAAWLKFSGIIGQWVMRGFGQFVLTDRTSGAPLGHAGPMFIAGRPEPEIAWAIWSDLGEGRGLAHEAAKAICTHVFEDLQWDTAVSYIATENRRSAALAERLGAVIDPEARKLASDIPHDVWRHPRRTE
ncbi:GNAT family N-acetyltransferase [Falsirhodobacter xinxiangensis]|uniref:GNAT family N-acetyltransferase n=1 Tax=Falsirhodobacter xinxiangensis TaxID=2530049 RepID=UPI0010A9E8F9|nr:GNAT family N-acetyltransferase [Rhodobacter xinxiangensis]